MGLGPRPVSVEAFVVRATGAIYGSGVLAWENVYYAARPPRSLF